MSREDRIPKKQVRKVLKTAHWISRHRKKKLPPVAREKLDQAAANLEEAWRGGDTREVRNRLKKLLGLLEGELARFRKSSAREWTESILFALAMVFLIRTFIVEPFKIPTGSMTPTLLGVKKVCPTCGAEGRYDQKTCPRDGTRLKLEHIGDKILVNKFIYGTKTPDRIPFTSILLPYFQLPALRQPRRGDIVVFHYPEEVAIDYVKRLVGLPGETIEIRGGKIIADGREVGTPEMEGIKYQNIDSFTGNSSGWWGLTGQRFTVPARGMVIPLDLNNRGYWEDLVRRDGGEVEVTNGTVYIDGKPRTSYTVSQDYYYVLGDNTGNSRDSRFWGFVPKKYLQGNVFFKYWPPRRWGIVR